MADNEETVSDDVAEEAAEAVAPSAVASEVPQALYTVISRLESLADRMTAVVERAPAETHPEAVADTAEEESRDAIPIRKPWTHRVPFQKHDD